MLRNPSSTRGRHGAVQTIGRTRGRARPIPILKDGSQYSATISIYIEQGVVVPCTAYRRAGIGPVGHVSSHASANRRHAHVLALHKKKGENTSNYLKNYNNQMLRRMCTTTSKITLSSISRKSALSTHHRTSTCRRMYITTSKITLVFHLKRSSS